jgi:parallel beta-helix repeat protein
MSGVFNVADYGAVADDGLDDRAAIQAALDAAEAAGGGDVILNAGTYDLTGTGDPADGCIQVRDNINLIGAGMGVTTLRVMDDWEGNITGIVRTPSNEVTNNVSFSGFTIDGNRDHAEGKIDGFFCGTLPGSPEHCENITVNAVEVKECSGYGFDPHEQTWNLTITNCVSHDNKLDGFTLDFIVGGTISNNIAYNNGRHGFQVVTGSSNLLLQDNISYDNGVSGLTIQRGSDDRVPCNNITVIGGSFYNNASAGIIDRLSFDNTITGVEVYGNGGSGIELWGTDNVTVTGNNIHDNSQKETNKYSEIRIEGYNDLVRGVYDVAQNNVITDNVITSDGTNTARYGILEATAAGATGTTIEDNTISGVIRGAVVVSNASSHVSGFDLLGTVVYGPAVVGTVNNETITGTDASESIYGAEGVDIMYGGKGDDTYYVDNVGDKANESSSTEGFDTVITSVDFILGNYIDNLTLVGSAYLGKGNSSNNTVTGTEAANSLNGNGGDDFVYGFGGDDILSGYTGNDTVYGGEGRDNIHGGDQDDTVYGDAGNDDVYGDKGNDFVYGGDGDDKVRGNDGNDVLFGGAGIDQVYGDAGIDQFVFDATALLGIDRVRDFNASIGEKLILSNLLVDFDPLTDAITDFVMITQVSSNSFMHVDVNGMDDAVANFVQIARLDNTSGLTDEALLLSNGTLVVS